MRFSSAFVSFIPLHLSPDIARGFLLHIVLLADHMVNSLTIELVFHYCTFRLKDTVFLFINMFIRYTKNTFKASLKTSPFLFALSLTASSCKGGKKKKNTRGETYLYAKFVYQEAPSFYRGNSAPETKGH